uniref:Uncharacterized protein n=1 Tax=Aegilops tauschii TaxID=37682 RepID=M8BUD5_AEGTA
MPCLWIYAKADDCTMSTASADKRKGSPGQQDDDPQAQGRKRLRSSVPDLPKDIWHHILSLLPLPDAARAGCVSQTFRSSWRSHPNLTLSMETLRLDGHTCREDKLARVFTKRVNRIMRKHSGGVRTFNLSYNYLRSFLDTSYLNRWLEIAVTPGIEEVKLSMPLGRTAVYYEFPCPVLSNGNGNSIRHLHLSRCAFHPTAGLGCLTRLFLLEGRKYLTKIYMQMFNTPILAVKFLFLKNLQIDLNDGQTGGFSPSYDYFSLAYFLDACPVLEKFVLGVSQTRVKHELISDGDSNMRRMPGHVHCSVKNVRIMGFCSAKSMVELTCHILENATSLERLTLDAEYDNSSYGDAERSCVGKKGECNPKSRSMIMHAHKGLEVIGKYVLEKVPSTVQLSVKKLCSRCHKIKPKGFRYEYRTTNP